MIILPSNFKFKNDDNSTNEFRNEGYVYRDSIKLFHKTSASWGSFIFSSSLSELTVRNLQDIFGILVRNIFLGERV